MKRLYYIFILFLLTSCAEKVDKSIDWPQWASRPIVADVSLKSESGGTTVTAGQTVRLTANIHDDFTELKKWSIAIALGDNVIFSKETEISGKAVEISESFNIPFSANLPIGGVYPDVTLYAVNAQNGISEVRLTEKDNVVIERPAEPEKLYLVGSKGSVIELVKTDTPFLYRNTPEADLSTLGEKVTIAEKVKGTSPDPSGRIWGYRDGAIICGSEEPIQLPSTEGHGYKYLGFNTFSFLMDRLVNYSVTIDKSQMDSEEQGGVNYSIALDKSLVRDCEVVFTGFGDLGGMLQPDRFEILSATSAKFTGQTRTWSFYYDEADGWMILDYNHNNEPEQIWVTGEHACFPLGNGETLHEFKYLEGDGKVRYATLSAVIDEIGDYHCMVYLKEGFHIQLYRWMKWSTLVTMVSLSPDVAEITPDGYYIRQATAFVPGRYMINIHFTNPGDTNGDGSKAEISLTPGK